MSKKYFEINLPETAPSHVVGTGTRKVVTDILVTVHKRMEKLEEALTQSGMKGEQFAAGAKILFDSKCEDGSPLLDTFDAKTLAAHVKLIASDIKTEPRYEWPNAIVVVDTAFLQESEWEAVRTIGIGGSDAAVTMGVSPYRTEQMLFHDKRGTEFEIPDNDAGKQFIFAYGHKLESLVIEEFCRRTGARIIHETRMFAKKGMPFITANIDTILEFSTGKLSVFEAKTTTNFNKAAWDNGKVPVQYVPQCNQYMSVLDDPRITDTFIGCIYGNTPNDFVCANVERDLDREAEQLRTEEDFWSNYVLTGTEPDPSGDVDKDMELLHRKIGYADKKLPAVELGSHNTALVEEYLALGDQRKALEKKLEGIKGRQKQISEDIIPELGKATKGYLKSDDDVLFEVTYSPRSQTSVDKEKMKAVYPEAYADCVKVNPENSRIFSVKAKRVRKAA